MILTSTIGTWSDLYAEPYDPERPVVCFDETSKQLLAEKRSPIPPKPARRERYDYEYQRNGTRNLFMLCEPLAGWRHVAVTERRTMVDFAQQIRDTGNIGRRWHKTAKIFGVLF